jgi:hypothetical protein
VARHRSAATREKERPSDMKKKILWLSAIGALAYVLYRVFTADHRDQSIWAEYTDELD